MRCQSYLLENIDMTDNYSGLDFINPSNSADNRMEIRYIRVADAALWEENSKLHDIGGLITSIEEHGFRDPPAWDNKLNAIVEGNGRTTALRLMEKQGRMRPRGVIEDSDGNWCMPVLFGLDADSQAAATRYGIDHNNLTMLGGDFTIFDVAQMWDTSKYIITLESLAEQGEMPTSVDFDDLDYIKDRTLRKTSEIDEDTEDGEVDDIVGQDDPTDDDSDSDDDYVDHVDRAVLVINVANFNLIDDVYDAICELLDANPGWDAKVARN